MPLSADFDIKICMNITGVPTQKNNMPVEERVMYPNTTQVSNYILDNINLFNDGELRVLLLITRKTIGWHKETDFLRYTQIIELSGKSKPVISKAIQTLEKKGFIIRVDKSGKVLVGDQRGRREETFYSLNKELVKNIDKLKTEPNLLKKLTRTSKDSLQYKTNSYKTNNINILAEPKKKDMNNDEKTEELAKAIFKPTSIEQLPKVHNMKSLGDALKEKGIPIKEKTAGIYYDWQEKAFRYAEKLEIVLGTKDKARWLKIFKQASEGRKAVNLETAYGYLADHPTFKEKSNELKLKNFFYIYENGVGNKPPVQQSFA